MKVTDLTADQIANFLVSKQPDVIAEFKANGEDVDAMVANHSCDTCRLLAAAFCKPEVMLVMLTCAMNGAEIESIFFGFHLALQCVQAVQEAEGLETLTRL
jgi:hypothetical protein